MLIKFKYLLLAFFLIASFFIGKEAVKNIYAQESDVGQWSEVQNWPVKAVHASLLPNGKVLIWPSFDFKPDDSPVMWDPVSNTFEDASKPGFNVFCAGHTLLGDGKLFVAGGHVDNFVGLPAASIYDSVNNTWTRVPDMNDARWYPTTTTLAGGNILTISGTIEQGVKNKIPQVYNISNNKWRSLTTAELSVPLYPFMYVAPNGKAFMAGPGKRSRYLNHSKTGEWETAYPSNFGKRGSGTSVMYAPGRILITGGGRISNSNRTPTKTAEIINLNASSPKWTYTSPMLSPRRHANATLLPTGNVLITGGTKGVGDDENSPVYFTEQWNPNNGNWKRLAGNKIYRGYHSIALLLPDGRVLVAGGEKSGRNAEIFSPPYLFKGARPEITSAPDQVGYGQKFLVKTPNASEIKAVRWISLGSVTHSFNQSQRINQLSFTIKSGGIEVTSVGNAKNAPPGYYMLFILNGKNVPSVGRMIKVGDITTNLSSIETPTTTFTTKMTPSSAHDHDDEEDEE